MAQSTSYSMPRGAHETRFLSFDDAPHSPNPASTIDNSAAQASTSQAAYDQDQPRSPELTPQPSGSTHASPSKTSRLVRSRPSSFKDLAKAAFQDASDASNRSESLHSSPPRAPAKQSTSRGSRLGALLGRSLPSTTNYHSRSLSSSTNHTEGASSNDSGFFGRRNLSKLHPASDDLDEAVDFGTAAQPSVSASSNAAGLTSIHASNDTTRAASALGMLEFKTDPSKIGSNSGLNDLKLSSARPPRPSSHSNLLDSFTSASSSKDSALGTPLSANATQQTRGGRLGRLAYKKEDSIAFIAQSRNASQRIASGSRNSCMQETGHLQQQSNGSSLPSAYGATRGLGIEDAVSSYPNVQYSASSASAVTHPSSHRYQAQGVAGVGESEPGVGVASSRIDSQSASTSNNTSSRAPSVAGTHSASYHNRFSRQGLSQELALDPTQESELRVTPAHTADAPAAAAVVPDSSRASYERSTNSPRGTLSDAAIAALGAMPGASAGSLLNASGAPLSSKNILTIALQKAQNAVQLDSANNVPEAIAAYKQAVRLLEEVMERIAPRNGKRSRPSREEERRRLRVIHDTYADRIRLLSMIYSPDLDANDESTDTSFSSNQQQQAVSTKTDWLDRMRDDSQQSQIITTPRLNDNQLGANVQLSPRDHTNSFLSMTPGGVAFATSSPQPGADPPQSSQLEHPFPKSPPLTNVVSSRRSPPLNTSPRRRVREDARPGSRESRGSRASVSLSIADEQEAQHHRLPPPVIDEEAPRISVEGATPNPAVEPSIHLSPKKQRLRDGATQLREADALAQQHGRSDSDSSYKSSATTSRYKSTSTLPPRTLGLEEEVRTPATPYFDASGEAAIPSGTQDRASGAIGPADAKARKNTLSLTSKPALEAPLVERPPEKPARMGLAQRARALSFKGPLLRQKASMPSLSDRRKDDGSSAIGGAVPGVPLQRHGSAEPHPVADSALSSQADVRGDHPTPWDEETGSSMTVRSGSNRPRASTASVLVSNSPAAGTISQRRKTPQQATEDEVEGVAAGDVSRAGSIAMATRQRSTSQQGLRRPSIPSAFISANSSNGSLAQIASAGGTPNGERLPPPVPDLARTLSALELKRPVDAQTLGKMGDASFATTGGDGDVSISTLAMPLPRPQMDESGAEAARDHAFLITDIFPSGLPSLAAGAPSYASSTQQAAPLAVLAALAHPLLRPFHIMEQLRLSIVSGAQITDRLYLSRSVWRQVGVKLVSVETKVRAIELLLSGLESVEKGGEALLLPLGSGAGLETSNASRFVKCLDEWEGLMADVQAMLAKKLTFLDSAGGSKKSGLGSRFTRGLDRMTAGVAPKTLDSNSITAYVDGLARLFGRCAILSTHLRWLLIAEGSLSAKGTATGLISPTGLGTVDANRTAYSVLPAGVRTELARKLRRSSEFMAKVVVGWVLVDVGLMLERGVRKGSGFE